MSSIKSFLISDMERGVFLLFIHNPFVKCFHTGKHDMLKGCGEIPKGLKKSELSSSEQKFDVKYISWFFSFHIITLIPVCFFFFSKSHICQKPPFLLTHPPSFSPPVSSYIQFLPLIAYFLSEVKQRKPIPLALSLIGETKWALRRGREWESWRIAELVSLSHSLFMLKLAKNCPGTDFLLHHLKWLSLSLLLSCQTYFMIQETEMEEGKVISSGWILSLLSTFHSSESLKAWQSIFHALQPHRRKLESAAKGMHNKSRGKPSSSPIITSIMH